MGSLESTAQDLAKLLYQTASAGTVNAELLKDAERKGYNNSNAGYDSLIDNHSAAGESIGEANGYVNQYIYDGPLENKEAFVTVTIDGHTVNFDKNMLETCSLSDIQSYSTNIVNNTTKTASAYQQLTGLDPATSVEIKGFQIMRGMGAIRGDYSTLFSATTNNMVGFNGTGPQILEGAPISVETHAQAPETGDTVVSDAAKSARKILGDSNGDEELTREEALKYFDKNGDGKITDKELGWQNGLVGTTTTVGSGELEHDETRIAGIKVESQSAVDKANFIKDYNQLAESSNEADKAKKTQLDNFFNWAKDATDAERKAFEDSIRIAQTLKIKAGKDKDAFANSGDAEWQQMEAMTPEQRAIAIKEADAALSLIGPSTEIGYTGEGMQTQSEIQRESDREEQQWLANRRNIANNTPTTSADNRIYGGMPNSPGQGTLTEGQRQAQIDREEVNGLRARTTAAKNQQAALAAQQKSNAIKANQASDAELRMEAAKHQQAALAAQRQQHDGALRMEAAKNQQAALATSAFNFPRPTTATEAPKPVPGGPPGGAYGSGAPGSSNPIPAAAPKIKPTARPSSGGGSMKYM